MNKLFSKFTLPKKSAENAKDRLKLILIHDRTDMNMELVNAMKEEIIQVISNHVEIDRARMKFSVIQEGREQRLMADIPLMPYSKR
jgi:cell division topological specificity factor